MSDQKYFATLPAEQLGGAILERVESYFTALSSSGQLDAITGALRCYYGGPYNSTAGNTKYLSRGGKYGQLRKVRVNHVRNLGLHILQLATSQKPTPQPVAINSDASSQESATLARGVLDYYSRFKSVDSILRSACERAIATGEGFVDTGWDENAGEILAQDGGRTLNEGDLSFFVMSALEVAREVSPTGGGIGDWVVLIKPANRYDLIAKYAPEDTDTEGMPEEAVKKIQEIRNAILNAPKISTEGKFKNRRPWGAILQNNVNTSDDRIAVFEFRHKKTPACKKGKLTLMTESGVVFQDGDLPFDDLNVKRLSASEMIDTPFSYSPLFDLLGIQEIIDALYSAVTSNQMAFATQLIWALKSADFDYRQLSHGITLLEGNDPAAEPKPLQLTNTPAEVFNFIEKLERAMETISGVNATVRGNPEYSLKSGSALAMVQSQAIQFSSTLQAHYAKLVEDVYTDILALLCRHADSPRQITIIGKFNRAYVKDFQGTDLGGIKRVVVDAGPAVGQTLAYKTEVARDLLQSGLIKRPEEYLAVVNTGRLEPMLEGENAELMLIQKENEDMKDGKPVYALPIDRHLLHIQEHRCAVADPSARRDAARVQAISDHVMEHVQFLADPAMAPLMMVLGETPLGMAVPPPPPGAQGGANPNGSQPAPKGKAPGASASGEMPTEPAAEMPPDANMPNMPPEAEGAPDTSV